MKPLLILLGRYILTLSAVAVAAVIAFILWKHYDETPWTRDGRIRADVVQIAPDVSGPVNQVAVKDNQWVNRGDILYSIDPQWLQLAVTRAQAEVDAKRHEMLMRQDSAKRRNQIKGLFPARIYNRHPAQQALPQQIIIAPRRPLDLAKLNLSRATIRSPVDGYVTHLRLRPGDYASAGVTKVAVIDADSFWVVGYFEETKMRHIHPGNAAQITLLGYDPLMTGHVESIGRGIDDSNDSPGSLGLPDVEPTFNWVRLAQRIPVRIHIDNLPKGIELVAGMSASVAISPVTKTTK